MLRGGSIFAALCQFRLLDRPRRLWADQCCINQDDPVERSQQVQYMSNIYRNAAHVLVWLGLDTTSEAILAFALVHELDETLRSHHVDGVAREADVVDLQRHLTKNRKALQALTDRAWVSVPSPITTGAACARPGAETVNGQFKRGWIVQEIGTSTPATLFWGSASIDWDTLASVCERLKRYHDLRSTLNITTSDISFLFRRFIEPDEKTHHANRFNFVYELQRARHLRFGDDRDRVFAFLGHFSVHSLHPLGCGAVSIMADYTKTVEQTYVDLALRILENAAAAACIVLAAVQHSRQCLPSLCQLAAQTNVMELEAYLRQRRGLPSWVPDWRRSEGLILAEPICPHRAHGHSITKIRLVEGSNLVLRAHGVEIDTIETCSQRIESRDFYGAQPRSQPFKMIERLWRDICMKGHFSLDDQYLDGKTAFFAFVQTLANGCVQAAGHECRAYDDIPDGVWLRKAARYIVETCDDVLEDIRRAAGSDAEREQTHEQWSRWATSASEGRVFARTAKGYYVLGPAALEAGDVVCVLFGCKVPFCLRPITARRYLLVGECYVHGLMKGEAMDMLVRRELCEQSFDIA